MAQNSLQIEIATPGGKRSIGEAQACSAPGVLGRFQILPSHAPLVSELSVGEIKIDSSEGTQYFAISGGYLEVVDNRVLLLLESAEAGGEIDVIRAEQALERAKDRLHHRKEQNVDVARAESALARAANRLKVAQRPSI